MVFLDKKRHFLTSQELKSKVALAKYRRIERAALLIDENYRNQITRENVEDFIDEEIMSADLIIQPCGDATVWIIPIKRGNRYSLYLMHDLKRLCAKWILSFCVLTGLDPNTISAWTTGQARNATNAHMLSAKKWKA